MTSSKHLERLTQGTFRRTSVVVLLRISEPLQICRNEGGEDKSFDSSYFLLGAGHQSGIRSLA